MPRISAIEKHPQRAAIEAHLAARTPLKTIAAQYGVTIYGASRHRTRLRTRQRTYFAQLRRLCQARGLGRKIS